MADAAQGRSQDQPEEPSLAYYLNNLRRSQMQMFHNGIIPGVISFLLLYGPCVALLWGLITHGESNQKQFSQTKCTARLKDAGFEGNSDFYGLGIRLGVYLQWFTSVAANALLPKDRRGMAGAYVAFSFALFVALLLLIFERQCTFTAEIVIILYLIWLGMFIVLPIFFLSVISPEPSQRLEGLQLAIALPTMMLMSISSWFWIRLSANGESDFQPSPSGTTIFLFARIGPSQLVAASRFIAFLSLWTSVTPFLIIAMKPIELLLSLKGLAPYVMLLTSPGFLFATTYSIGYLLSGCYALVWFLWQGLRQVAAEEMAARWAAKVAHPNYLFAMFAVSTFGQGFVVTAYAVCAIELTIYWNRIQGVYVVDSTGQIIPLIVGVCLVINVLWKLFFSSPEVGYEDAEARGTTEESFELQHGSFQAQDGTWR